MSEDFVVLQDEVEGEKFVMTLSDAKKMLSWVLRFPDGSGSGLEELMMELPALLKRLQKQDINDDYWEACVIDLLTKIRHEIGYLPSIQPGDLVKDLFLANEAVEKLEDNDNVNDNIVDIFGLLQQKEAPRSRSRKRHRRASNGCRTWSVRLIALLGRMACAGVGEEETVAWTAVEARVWGWIQSSFSLLPQEVNAGLALAALDIMDSARAQDAVVGRTRVTGLTPRHVAELLQKPGVDSYLEISTTVPRLSFLAHFADIFIQYSVHFQDDASLFDSAGACNDVMRLAFINRPEFLLNKLSDHASSTTSMTTTTTTTSNKRKRIESSNLDPTSRWGRILARGYPFLVRLQIFLMNDEWGKAFTLAKDMEHCCALSEDERAQAWGFVMNYLQDIGQVFLDDNDRNSGAYVEKRRSLILLRQHMGNLGLNTLVDYYKQLITEVSNDPYATPQEIQYVTMASQHTVLRLLMLVNVDDGIKRMLDEFPSLYVWGDDANAKRNWAVNFLHTPNAIPESLVVDGIVDLRSLLSRAPKEKEVAPPPVPVREEIEFEVVDEAPAQVVQEQEVENILASSVEESADQEAYSAQEAEEPEVEEILDSSDEEPAEGQEVEEILDSSDDEVGQQSYSDEQEQFEESIDSSDDEPVGQNAYSDDEADEADEEQLEESIDSDEYSAGQEQYPANDVVEIIDWSTDDADEQFLETEQEVENSESEQLGRQARGGEETADEDEVAERKVEDHESEPLERRTRDGEETADEDDVAALFGSKVAGDRLEPVHEAINYYDQAESSDEGRRGSFEGVEEAQGVMEHDDGSSTEEEEVHEREHRDVELIVDSSETEDTARGEDQGDDQYFSDDEEVAREEQGDQDSSEDQVVVIDDEGSNEAYEAEPQRGGKEFRLEEGYEPDTAGKTESEEDADDRLARNEASTTRKALGSDQIPFRTTFSDMDAADEQDESSGVEDNVRKERPSSSSNAMDSETSSTLVVFAQSAQQDASVTWKEDHDVYTSPSRSPPRRPAVEERVVDKLPNLEARDGDDTSAAVAASDAERYLSEAGTVPVVDAVPRIEDVHEGEDDTMATVAYSEASLSLASQPSAGTNMTEPEGAQEHVAIVNQVPTVEDARLGDDTSATFAASEAGRCLSEAKTERISEPEESVDIEKHEKSPCASDGAEKDSQDAVDETSSTAIIQADVKSDSDIPRRSSDGMLSDRAGYEADEERTDVENSARSVPDETEVENSARSVAVTETTGYEADIEEKTPLFIPAVTSVAIGMETPGPGYEADVEEKDVPEVEASQPEPCHPSDSSGMPTANATGAPYESASVHPEIESMQVAVAETESHEPLPGPSAQAAAKSDDSGNEAEELKVYSVSSPATRDDETGSVAYSVRKLSLRKAPLKQKSDFEYYGLAAKKQRIETATKKNDVSAGAPPAEDKVDAQEIAEVSEVFPSIPASATAQEHDASSAHPHFNDAVETDTKSRTTRRTTRGNREKKGDDSDEDSSIPEPSRPSTRRRTASSLRTHSHDPSVETESKDSPITRKARATRTSREKKDDDEEAEIDVEGASNERHRIMALKVADLRDELRQRGLDTGGLKKELQSRLLRNAEETMTQLGSPERHTRSHDSATRSSHQPIQGLESPASHTRSHDSLVTTRHSLPTRTKDFKPASKDATKKSKTASKAATKKSETDSLTFTADSKASTKKLRTRSSIKGAKSEADSENRESLGSNPEGRAISYPTHDEENDFGSLSSVESSVASPARSRLAGAVTRRTSLRTVPENEDSSSVVSSVSGRPRRAATQRTSLETLPENDSGETLSAPTARTTRSRRSNVKEAPAKRRKSDRSFASVASTTKSGRASRTRNERP